MSRSNANRNVHFLDAHNNEVLGFWQNGFVTWEEIQEWMHIVITNSQSDYVPFRCLEDDPLDPVGQHGPPIYTANNNNVVDASYYVLLSGDGELPELESREKSSPLKYSRRLRS